VYSKHFVHAKADIFQKVTRKKSCWRK